jgi:hypothetical protein
VATAEPRPGGGELHRWYAIATTFVAPATLVSALLFYFGYVSSRAQYAYFGVDVDTLGLGTRDYVMRSPQVLLVPALVLTLGGAGLLVVHHVMRRRRLPSTALRVGVGAAGVLLLGGLVLLFGFRWFGDHRAYGVVTPASIAAGVALAVELARWHARDTGGPGLRPGVWLLTLLAIGTSLFWLTATVAESSGLGVARRSARQLDRLPMVILDTQERLYLTDGVVRETALPTDAGQVFRYRYRGLHLLVQGEDRMLLVPERWTPNNSTLLVPLDGSVRVQFRFVDQPPTGSGHPPPPVARPGEQGGGQATPLLRG